MAVETVIELPKRPETIFAERGFLTDPRPEEFLKLANFAFGEKDQQVACNFTVGVKIIEDNGAGLRIGPTAQVVFAIDDKEVDLPPCMVRDLIPRLQQFCDAADKRNNANGR
jgi:hypothetical protein